MGEGRRSGREGFAQQAVTLGCQVGLPMLHCVRQSDQQLLYCHECSPLLTLLPLEIGGARMGVCICYTRGEGFLTTRILFGYQVALPILHCIQQGNPIQSNPIVIFEFQVWQA